MANKKQAAFVSTWGAEVETFDVIENISEVQ